VVAVLDFGQDGAQEGVAVDRRCGMVIECRGKAGDFGWQRGGAQIDADAERGIVAGRLEQEAAKLSPGQQQVVGPAQLGLHPGDGGDGIGDRQTRSQRE